MVLTDMQYYFKYLKKVWVTLGLSLLLLSSWTFAPVIWPDSLWKKVDKGLEKNGMKEAVKEPWMPNLSKLPEGVVLSGNETFYRLKKGENILGYLAISSAPSRHNHFELLVRYDTALRIKQTQILTYREDYGGEIMSERWLKQFMDKTFKDPIEVSQDIQGISGATISVRSATQEIHKLTALIQGIQHTHPNTP